MSDISMVNEDTFDMSVVDAEMAEMEEEQRKLREIRENIFRNALLSPQPRNAASTAAEADLKSVYVGNVDYGCSMQDIENHFNGCGSVARVTILRDKFCGRPKGFAYVEFTERAGMQNALAMSDSLLRGRQIKVSQKRTNTPGISTTNPPPPAVRGRGRGGRGRGRGQSTVIVEYVYVGGANPRGRGNRRFAPY